MAKRLSRRGEIGFGGAFNVAEETPATGSEQPLGFGTRQMNAATLIRARTGPGPRRMATVGPYANLLRASSLGPTGPFRYSITQGSGLSYANGYTCTGTAGANVVTLSESVDSDGMFGARERLLGVWVSIDNASVGGTRPQVNRITGISANGLTLTLEANLGASVTAQRCSMLPLMKPMMEMGEPTVGGFGPRFTGGGQVSWPGTTNGGAVVTNQPLAYSQPVFFAASGSVAVLPASGRMALGIQSGSGYGIVACVNSAGRLSIEAMSTATVLVSTANGIVAANDRVYLTKYGFNWEAWVIASGSNSGMAGAMKAGSYVQYTSLSAPAINPHGFDSLLATAQVGFSSEDATGTWQNIDIAG